MKKIIILLGIVFLMTMEGCYIDEPSSSKDSSFTVNGIKISKILYTLCEISSVPKAMVLEAHFDYDDTTYSLDMALTSIKRLDDVDAGDKFDADDFTIYKFYPMNWAYVGSKNHEPLSGTARVKSVSSNAVVIEYSNFKFLRELGGNEDTFTINGTISYTIND